MSNARKDTQGCSRQIECEQCNFRCPNDSHDTLKDVVVWLRDRMDEDSDIWCAIRKHESCGEWAAKLTAIASELKVTK